MWDKDGLSDLCPDRRAMPGKGLRFVENLTQTGFIEATRPMLRDIAAVARFSRKAWRVHGWRRTVSHALVDQEALDELSAVIGTEKLVRILDRFVLSLATAFEGPDRDDADYGREAHTLVSMSGMLGCSALSLACRDLEQSAKAGGDLSGPLVDLRSLRDRTLAALRDMRAEVETDA
jgi:HPt (histidine-containing phosphotransfer) domain-containing protein